MNITAPNLDFICEWLPTVSQHFLMGSLCVLFYVVTTRLRREQRMPSTAIAWVMGLALLPYVVLPMYLAFGRRKLRPESLKRLGPGRPDGHWAEDLLESMGLAPAGWSGTVQMHPGGADAQQALWDLIAQAQQRLDVCTFIIGNDAFGQDVVGRLAQRARDGLSVRVLLDGFGALTLPRRYLRTLRQAGCEVVVFRPFFSLRESGPRNLRNHRKLVVADDRWLWSGGRNLAGEYFEGKAGEPPWRDISFVLDGPCARAAAMQFEKDWASVRQRPLRELAPDPNADLSDGSADQPPLTPAPGVASGAPSPSRTQFLPSGPDQLEDTAHALLLDACFRAERRILAITPYFLPDDSLRNALRLASRRGVDITIVIPATSNHRLADFVRTRAMRDLASAGVHFRLLPFMAHAKAVVVDDVLALCGSINLDLRSLLLNHEASVVFYSRCEIDWLAGWIEDTAEGAGLWRAERPGLLRDIAEGLVLAVAFQL
ncbi:MAG: phospholipase D-like domain-containing protein [Polaromonas sp.]|nr:phospholipase D-like domain-containing protein [Polaromonas sp.]